MKSKRIVTGLLAFTLAAAGSALSGCGSSPRGKETAPVQTAEPSKPPVAAPTPGPTVLPEPASMLPGGTGNQVAEAGAQSAAAGTDGSGAGTGAGQNVTASSDATPPQSKPDETVAAFSGKKPALLGISLKDSMANVVQKLGKPEHEYIMEDDADPITAYEYSGWVVGFNRAKLVQFVEITSGDVNPGLNGFRLGQSMREAVEALGKPDASTKYTLSYKGAGSILKLDVDPMTQAVLSIKLFADDSI